MPDLRAQIDAEKRLLGYRFHADPTLDDAFTAELVAALRAWGIADVRALGFHRGFEQGTRYRTEQRERGDSFETVTVAESVTYPVAWFVNRSTGAKLASPPPATLIDRDCVPGPDPNTPNMEWRDCPRVPGPDDAIPLWTVGGPDRWKCQFFVAFMPDDTAYFLPHSYRQSSSWQDFREALLFFFAVASFAVPGLGATIGSAVFGAQTAAAYPALVGVATQTAMQAVLGGVDIEEAVKRAVASYASGGFGNLVGAGVDSALIGRLTAAATRAALTDADIGQAVALATLQYGATMPVGSGVSTVIDQPAKGGAMDFGDFNSDTGAVTVTPGGDYDYVFDLSGDPMFASPGADMIDLSGDPMMGGGYDVPVNVPPLSPSEGGGWNSVLQTVSQSALTALQLYKAFQSAGAPAPKAGLPSQTVNANGTLTTRSPNGTVSVSKPTPGQPYVMADGTLLLNNGDGTYTLIAPNGSRTTHRYSEPTSGALTMGPLSTVPTQQWVMIGALGLGALWLLSKRRRA